MAARIGRSFGPNTVRKKVYGQKFILYAAPETSAAWRDAARIMGMSQTEWARMTLTYEALRTRIAAANRSMRLRPGTIVWGLEARENPVEPMRARALFAATGKERIWVKDVLEGGPTQVDVSGKCLVVDVVDTMIWDALVPADGVFWAGIPPIQAELMWPRKGTTYGTPQEAAAEYPSEAPNEEPPTCTPSLPPTETTPPTSGPGGLDTPPAPPSDSAAPL